MNNEHEIDSDDKPYLFCISLSNLSSVFWERFFKNEREIFDQRLNPILSPKTNSIVKRKDIWFEDVKNLQQKFENLRIFKTDTNHFWSKRMSNKQVIKNNQANHKAWDLLSYQLTSSLIFYHQVKFVVKG